MNESIITQIKAEIEKESYFRNVGTPEELFIEGANFILPLLHKYRSELHACIDLMPDMQYVSREELRNAIDVKALELLKELSK